MKTENILNELINNIDSTNTVKECLNHGKLLKSDVYFFLKKNKYLLTKCKKCCKEYNEKNKDYIKKRKRDKYNLLRSQGGVEHLSFLRKFKINKDEYEKYCDENNNKCNICNKSSEEINLKTKLKKRLCLDHCHKQEKNGKIKIRGLLCHNCNAALGFMEDSPERLRKAAKYLDESNAA